MIFTDKISNFLVGNSDNIYWGNLDVNGNARRASTSFSVGDSAPNAVALSSNKLVVLFDSKVDYYQLTGTGKTATFSLLFSKTFTASDVEASGDYRFTLTCVCKSLVRLSCYSSTLNCLLIKKAVDTCGGRDIPTPV
jgi:hypothetical protein